jgi:hypothetical protein
MSKRRPEAFVEKTGLLHRFDELLNALYMLSNLAAAIQLHPIRSLCVCRPHLGLHPQTRLYPYVDLAAATPLYR